MTQYLDPLPVLALLALFSGIVHVLAPDHWLPVSVFSWQRQWKVPMTLLFTGIALFFHVLTGYLIFLIFRQFLEQMDSIQLFLFTLILFLILTGVRRFRFPLIQDVFRGQADRFRGGCTVLSLLGPCEVIVPLFVKAKQLGLGYLTPFGAFLMGTLIGGIGLVFFGRSFWDRPFGLPRVFDWANRQMTAFPLFGGLTLSMGCLAFL